MLNKNLRFIITDSFSNNHHCIDANGKMILCQKSEAPLLTEDELIAIYNVPVDPTLEPVKYPGIGSCVFNLCHVVICTNDLSQTLRPYVLHYLINKGKQYTGKSIGKKKLQMKINLAFENFKKLTD